jgi:aminoglycoside phosphotransferase (APT) family kinase protein
MSSQQLYDLDALRSFLRDQAGITGPIDVTGRAPGGSSNITLFLDVDGERWVLRRPPAGDLLPTSHDMLREYRFLRAIHGTPVPVPEPIVACADPTVIGAPFYTMRYVEGLLLSGQANNPGLAQPDECRALTTQVISVLADLHGLDWAGLGLEGKPTGFLQRQVRRWTEQLSLTPTAPRLGPGLAEVTAWIAANVPDSRRESIVHGDYTPNNILVRQPPGARVAAVLDWEMATIGDPLADVAWLMQGWAGGPRSGENPAAWITRLPGSLSREEAVNLYEQKSGAPFENQTFYRAFSMWKSIAILEGLYALYVEGRAADPGVARFEHSVPQQVSELVALLNQL